jgi:RNA polymerase sigma-70 factor (ECF subfamily)
LQTFATGLLCLAVILQLAACGVSHIQTLRDAEQTFSRAAEMDNRERLDGAASMAAAGGAASGYRVAESMVSELIASKGGELRQDNLLCTAYLIEAMSLWRLGEEDAAVRAADQGKDCAQAASRDTVPRDRALLYAVPALVRIDQANALALNDTAGEREFDREKTEIVRALATLEEAEAMVSPDHPVRGYLMNARLAALRVWQVARLLVPDGNPNALLRFAVTVARRLALSEARRRHPGAELPPDLPVAPVEPDPRLRELIRTCLALLPPQPRLAMLARIAARGGEDDRSLARRVQMKLNTFLQNVTRARRLVAECLKSKGVDPETSS